MVAMRQNESSNHGTVVPFSFETMWLHIKKSLTFTRSKPNDHCCCMWFCFRLVKSFAKPYIKDKIKDLFLDSVILDVLFHKTKCYGWNVRGMHTLSSSSGSKLCPSMVGKRSCSRANVKQSGESQFFCSPWGQNKQQFSCSSTQFGSCP